MNDKEKLLARRAKLQDQIDDIDIQLRAIRNTEMRAMRAERDEEIFSAWYCCMPQRWIADMHKLSISRVAQIIKREYRRKHYGG